MQGPFGHIASMRRTFVMLAAVLCAFVMVGGCSYSFVNWEMLSVRPNRGMLTPSH